MKTDIHRSPAFWAVLFVLCCFYSWHVVNDSRCDELMSRNKELDAQLKIALDETRIQKDNYEKELSGVRTVLKTLKTEMVTPVTTDK